MIINLTDPELRALWEQKISNPSAAEIIAIADRLKITKFERFFDLLGHIAMVGQLAPEIQQQTFKSLMLTILAHCADATATAHSAPWLERIRQIEATIRRSTSAAQSYRNKLMHCSLSEIKSPLLSNSKQKAEH